MKKVILAALVAAFCGIAGAPVQAAPVSQQAGIVGQDITSPAVEKVRWHRRWRSHRRWGSRRWHRRWRSHRRWGSRRWHRRWRSHRRWGSRRW